MTPTQHAHLLMFRLAFFADRPKQSVSAWCEQTLRFDEPDNRGPFTLTGREYCREPLDNWSDFTVTDQVEVFASQTGKTGISMGGVSWTIVHDAARLFWVLPTRDKARSFSKTRWQTLCRASAPLAALIPSGRHRHAFSTLQQMLGGAIVDIVWSNSPAALSGDPARIVILDEVDKFPENPGAEADSVNLAEQRTKSFVNPKRFLKSTPTLTSGLIWQNFLKTDQRRRFVPCPGCGKFVVFAWSRDFTVFKLTGDEAFVRWDKEAQRTGGTWDDERVERSARLECPHCGFHIRDGHKAQMDKAGEWRASASAGRQYRGYHLPGMYSSVPENGLGKMALRFLKQKHSLLGLQGFINGDLAEPWENQEARGERIEIIARPDAPPIAEKPVRILSADYQLYSPKLPFVIREWAGHSRLVRFGFADSFEELRQIQLDDGISDNHVCVDSGHAAEEVYAACLRFGKLNPRVHGLPLWVGWTPSKGFDRRQQWQVKVKTPDGKQEVTVLRPFNLGSAALTHRRFRLPLLEFSTNHLKDIFERLRAGKTPWRWELNESADEEYFRHLDADVKKAVYEPMTHRVRYVYVKRSRTWPDHLRDCEIISEAMALLHRLLPIGGEK